MQPIKSIREITNKYDCFLFDQWGVLHSGKALFDGVIDFLNQLLDDKKVVVIISNSGKRADSNIKRMKQKGFTRIEECIIATSGEVTHSLLKNKSSDLYLGQKCFYIPYQESFILNDTGITTTNIANEADFAILASTNVGSDKNEIETAVDNIKQYKLPLICTNPDKVSFGANGDAFEKGPGIYAEECLECGCNVKYIGKPHNEIYQYIYHHLPNNFSKERILAIGDSIEHDIKGANEQKIDSLLITSGIHKSDIIEEQCKIFTATPTYYTTNLL